MEKAVYGLIDHVVVLDVLIPRWVHVVQYWYLLGGNGGRRAPCLHGNVITSTTPNTNLGHFAEVVTNILPYIVSPP